MTLVAGLSVGGMPAFVGDLLVSWRVPSAVDLPTQWHEAVYPSLGGDYAAGLAQKLIIVRPYFMLAWSGARAEVERMIQELDYVLPSNAHELDDIEVIFEILNTCTVDTEMVALLILDQLIYPFGVRTRGFELDKKRIYLLGSGASEFFEYVQTHPEILPNQERTDGQLAQAIMLRFAARAMVSQFVIGTGLQDSWGGGFEVAYPGQDGFRKIGDLLCRAWMINEKGGYDNSGRSFFLRYYGQNPHLSWFGGDEKSYVIPSPISQPCDIPRFEEVAPEWTLDFFIFKPSGFIVEFARFHSPCGPVKDKLLLESGSLVGWSMDREYVEQCVRMARTVSRKRNHFEVIRY